MADPKKNQLSPETITAQALGRVDRETRALVPPLHTSTTYERDADLGYSSGRGYTRPHNPTYDAPEELLCTLEGGSACLVSASGMAAATSVFQSLLPGDHVIAPRVMYWALRTWLVDFAMSWGLQVEFVDTSDLDALSRAMRVGKTRLVWIETPANPTWDVTDIAGAADIAHAGRAKLAVDSTVATPVLTRPLEFGADLVVHSATKYLNGHSDVLAGALVCAEQDSFWQRIRAWRRDGGAVLGPFEAWLLLRGMRTLFVRVRRSAQSALSIAEHFSSHASVSVLYPGLPDHPGHQIAAAQMSGGFGGMLSLRHRDGEAAAVATAAAVQVFKRATSLGGVESLIEHRASIEGPATPVPADLLRLSIGLEDPVDLIADLEQALMSSAHVKSRPLGDQHRDAANTQPDSGDVHARIQQLLDERVYPLVADRGCELRWRRFEAGVLTLDIEGSPGACLPIRSHIEKLFQHYVPEVTGVELLAPTANTHVVGEVSLGARIQQVLDAVINPAVKAHGGLIYLHKVEQNSALVELQGRCQGCAMANVTLRQGVEVILKEQVAGLDAVVDVTDHTAGTNPYFKTKKGTD